MENLDKKIEAILFATGREVSIKEISDTLKVEKNDIEKALEILKNKYEFDSGVVLVKINDSYQLTTNKDYYNDVSKFVESTKKQNLSTSALETLTIIAYNPKITKSEIEAIRGVNSDFAVSRLQECGLVEEVARLNLPGRPAAYSVTSEFFRVCGIEKLEDLPEYENVKIKDEQMLISDYKKNEDQKDESDNKQ